MAWGGFPYFEQLIKKQIDQLQDFILKYLHQHIGSSILFNRIFDVR
jgi:hypothetical protein